MQPRLPWILAVLGAVLTAPSIAIGFHLDDYLHRFVYSGAEEGRQLLDAYGSPFGIANGDPASNRWQIERGYAPWWTPEDLLVSPFRPLSALSHQLDAALWPSSAWLQHVHSVLWYALLCALATGLFRSLLGKHSALAGLCALLYATDYTHGFAVGWIANRNAVIAACFGVASLWAFIAARARTSAWLGLGSAALLALAMLAGESSLAVFGYMIAYALCLDRAPLLRRALSLAPHVLVVLAWQALYKATGHGAHGSGLYLDPAREPLRFALALLERVPLVLLGQLGTPPAESPLFLSPQVGTALLVFALVVSAWLLLAAAPLLRRDAIARFFALGMCAAIPLACATHPHSRLLYFVGLGALGLLARLWHGVVQHEAWVPHARPFSTLTYGFAAAFMGFHLLVSPLLLPLMACSMAVSAPIQRGVESALDLAPGRDLIVLNAPEFFYVKLIPIENALRGAPSPRRLRALSFGAVAITVARPDSSTLELRFAGGLLREPLLQLYRNADDPLPVGTRITLEGLTIEVTEQTRDGRVLAARFGFDRPLDDPQLQLAVWEEHAFRRFTPPPVGGSARLQPAQLRLGR